MEDKGVGSQPVLQACGDAEQRSRRKKFSPKVKTAFGSSEIYFGPSWSQ